jgi:hypothetical protein
MRPRRSICNGFSRQQSVLLTYPPDQPYDVQAEAPPPDIRRALAATNPPGLRRTYTNDGLHFGSLYSERRARRDFFFRLAVLGGARGGVDARGNRGSGVVRCLDGLSGELELPE